MKIQEFRQPKRRTRENEEKFRGLRNKHSINTKEKKNT